MHGLLGCTNEIAKVEVDIINLEVKNRLINILSTAEAIHLIMIEARLQ